MKDKNEIVSNWLPRYTGLSLSDFGEHILLTNFGGYLNTFSRLAGAPIVGLDRGRWVARGAVGVGAALARRRSAGDRSGLAVG